MKSKKRLSSFLVLLYMVTFIIPTNIVKAATEYVSVTKTVNVTQMTNEEEAEVTLSIKGTPPVDVVKPNDVVLIIDKSGSMGTEKMEAAKSAAKSFIDLMDMTKHQVGLVDFSDNAYATPLTTDITGVKNRISSLSAGGGTQTGVAIRSAINVLSNHRPEAQPVIVILTDGAASNTQDALNAAQQAKDLGIVFYTIALLGTSDNPDTNQWNTLLKNMATTEHHHHFVLGSQGLDAIYKAIVQEIGIASAYNVVVKDTIAPNFELVPGSADGNIPKPTINGNELTWNFLELKQDTLNFTYKIRHKSGSAMGTIPVGTNTTVSYSDFAGAKRDFSITSPSITVKYPAPAITSIEADNGEIAGGNEVIIRGDKFRQGATVHFATKLATNVTVVSSNEIRATVPAGTVGTVNVKVTNEDSQFATSSYRYWASPVITKINPNNGPLEGGNIVAIEGNYFASGIKVFFGNVQATATYKNPMLVYAYAPKGISAGVVDITLTNVDGTSVTKPGAYTYNGNPAPSITSISPNSGDIKGGNVVTLIGTNLSKVNGVKFSETFGTNLTIVDNTTIKVTVPGATQPSVVDVTAINSDGQVFTSKDGYTYNVSPVITSITPNFGKVEGGNTVTISGDNFLNISSVKFASNEATNITVVDNQTITATVPASTIAGVVDVAVTNAGGQSFTLNSAYTYNASPIITSITPSSGKIEGGNNVTISGSNFLNGVTVKFSDNQSTNVSLVDSKTITATVPANSQAGVVDVTVTNADNQSFTLNSAYTYNAAPIITSMTPTSGETAGGNTVTITGDNFQKGATIKFGSKVATNITLTDNKTITATVPASTEAGVVSLTVTNADGQFATKVGAYTYIAPPPTISSLSVTEGLTLGGEYIFVYGTGFKSGVVAKVGGVKALSTTYYSATQVRVQIPPCSTVGAVDIELQNPDGQIATKAGAYTYVLPAPDPAPTISSLSATEGSTLGGQYIFVYGTGFKSGVVAKVGGVKALSTTYYSATQVRVQIPPCSTGGAVDLELQNPDGQIVTKVGAYTYVLPAPDPAPTISSLSATQGYTSGGEYVFVYGTGFKSGSIAKVGGKNVPVTYYSATQVRIQIPSSTIEGLVDIEVINPDGQSAVKTNAYTYLPVMPEITSLSKTEGVITGQEYVFIYGKNFVSGTKVKVGGINAISVTYYSSTQIRIQTPAGSKLGTVDIEVINPDGKSTIKVGAYTYIAPPPPPSPVVTSLSKTTGSISGGGNVFLYGQNFENNMIVKLGGVTVPYFMYYSSTSCLIRIPAATSSGTVDLTITDSKGQIFTLPGAYTYTSP